MSGLVGGTEGGRREGGGREREGEGGREAGRQGRNPVPLAELLCLVVGLVAVTAMLCGEARPRPEARVHTPLHVRMTRASGGAGASDSPYARISPLESLATQPGQRDSSSLPVNHEGC